MDTRTPKPWERLTIYNRSNLQLNNVFELSTTIIQHKMLQNEDILHQYRNRINEYEELLKNGKNWEYYKKVVNPFELVYTQKKYEEFPESICILKPLSRSYFKMIEMLDLINFFKSIRSENIRAAHVCEGPGGFIEALVNEAFRHKKKVQTSIAMTLKSRQSNIPGWRRATHFLQNNRCVRIIYGQDDTGDIMKPENQQYFIDYCVNPSYGGKMHIFTADGGFDFSNDYSKQEELIFPLLVASTKIGFEVLKKGGIFILKIFDFYQKATTDLLYFLSSHFQKWTLYKPSISRPCNPEQYFIGIGFTGCSDEVLDVMRLWCNIINNNQPLHSLYKEEYSNEFITLVDKLRQESFKTQTEYLEKVFSIIDEDINNSEKEYAEIIKSYLRNNEKISYEWCMRFKVPIYVQRSHLIEVSRNDQPISFQQ